MFLKMLSVLIVAVKCLQDRITFPKALFLFCCRLAIYTKFELMYTYLESRLDLFLSIKLRYIFHFLQF